MIKNISQFLFLLLIYSCSTQNIQHGYYQYAGQVFHFDTSNKTFQYYSSNCLSGIGYSKGNYSIVNDTIFLVSKGYNDFVDIKISDVNNISDSFCIHFNNFNSRFNHSIYVNNQWIVLKENNFFIADKEKFEKSELAVKIEMPPVRSINSCSHSRNYIVSKIDLNKKTGLEEVNVNLDYNFFVFDSLKRNIVLKKGKLNYSDCQKCVFEYKGERDSSHVYSFNDCGY